MISPARRRSLLARIGGPHSLSWPVFAVVYAFTWIAYVLGLPTVGWADPFARVAVLTACQLAMFAVLLGAKWTFLRDTATRPRPWLTLVTFAVASAMVGRPAALLLEARGVTAQGSLSARFPGGWPATFIVLVLTALAVDAIAEHRRRRSMLLYQRDRLAHTRLAVTAAIADRQQRTVEQIRNDLTRAVDKLSENRPQEAVDTLRWAAHDIVRPLSHELATQADGFDTSTPPVQLLGLDRARVLKDAMTGRAIPPVALAVTLSVMSFAFTLNRLGVASGLLTTLAGGVAVWLGAHAANRVLAAAGPRLTVGMNAWAFTGALVALGLLATLVSRPLATSDVRATAALLGVGATVFIGWALALTRAVQHQFAHSEAELVELTRELEWEIARANQTQWQQQRALARALHGPLQAAVNAAALRLDAAVREGTVTAELIGTERRSIIDALGILPSAVAEGAPDIALAFQRVQGTWIGVCDIDFEVPETVLANIAADPACASAVIDIVTESSANAIRHGHASHVNVRITQPDSERLVFISIDNDGDPPDPASPAGLGTSLIDDVALEWHVDAGPDGVRLTATLPTATGPLRSPDRLSTPTVTVVPSGGQMDDQPAP